MIETDTVAAWLYFIWFISWFYLLAITVL